MVDRTLRPSKVFVRALGKIVLRFTFKRVGGASSLLFLSISRKIEEKRNILCCSYFETPASIMYDYCWKSSSERIIIGFPTNELSAKKSQTKQTRIFINQGLISKPCIPKQLFQNSNHHVQIHTSMRYYGCAVSYITNNHIKHPL